MQPVRSRTVARVIVSHGVRWLIRRGGRMAGSARYAAGLLDGADGRQLEVLVRVQARR
jgi:hypothetical protein